ncbi:MAG: hypothetical protein ACWA44_04675 [Thiotrichales bacterium]
MIKKALFNYTAKKPCRLIRTNNKRYLERYYLGRLFGMTFYIHRFVASDGDRALHDHPWKFCAALCLAGGYQEKRLRWFNPETGYDCVKRKIRPGKFNIIRISNFHQILQTQPETWTLFMHTPKIKSWGFLNKKTELTESGETLTKPEYLADGEAASHAEWWLTAPLGQAADRAPFQG